MLYLYFHTYAVEPTYPDATTAVVSSYHHTSLLYLNDGNTLHTQRGPT